MATLAGNSIASSYTSLLKLNGNTDSTAAGNGSNAIQVKTGDDDATPLFLNTDRVGIGGQPSYELDINLGSGTAQARINTGANAKTSLIFKNSIQEWEIGNSVGDNNKFTIRDITDSRNAFVIDGSGDVSMTGVVTHNSTSSLVGNVGIGSITGAAGGKLLFVDAGDGVSDNNDIARFRNQEATDGRNYGVSIIAGSNSTDNSLNVMDKNSNTNFIVKGDGLVGIGISDPDAYLAGTNNLVIGGTSGSHGLTIRSANDGSGQISFGDGDASTDAGYRGQIRYIHSSDSFQFITGSVSRILMNSNGTGIGTTNPAQGQSTPISDIKLDVAGNQMLSNLSSTNSDESKLFFFRSDGAVGSQGAVPDGLKIGAIEWTALTSGDDNNSITSARIEVEAGSTWSSASNRNADITFSTVGANTLAERMRIDSSGNILIGSSGSALGTLDVRKTSAGDYLYIAGSSDGGRGLTFTSSDVVSGGVTFAGASHNINAGSGVGSLSISVNGSSNVKFKLDSDSRISLGNNDSSGATSNTIFGRLAGNAIASGAIDNVLIGNEAGNDVTTGDYLVAIGSHALSKEDVGRSSIAIGASALGSQNTVGEGSVNTIGIGTNAGYYNVTGTENVHIGHNSGLGTDGQNGSNITAVGNEALKVAYGQDNVAIGRQAGLAVTSGVRNCLIGNNTGDDITDANYVTAVGIFAGSAINHTEASGSTFIGYSSGLGLQGGQYNTAVGYESLKSETDGDYNTAVGYDALKLQNGVSGTVGNTSIGAMSGDAVTTGKQNTFIGAFAGSGTADVDATVAIGYGAMGNSNVTSASDGTIAIGDLALANLVNGARNVAIGRSAMLDSAGAGDNVVVGHEALKEGSTSEQNVAIGSQSLGSNSASALTGNANTAVGFKSLYVAQGTARTNTAVGQNTLQALTTGYRNVVMGGAAAYSLTTGIENTMIGTDAGGNTIDSGGHTLVGYDAGGNGDIANDGVTAIGHSAGAAITSAQRITAVGYAALFSEDAGSYQTAVGFQALAQVNNDNGHNTAVGQRAGYTLTGGYSNTLIGSATSTSSVNAINQTAIGMDVTGQSDNSVTLGNVSVTDVYMAQDSGARVHAGGLTIKAQSNHILLHDTDEGDANDLFRLEHDGGAFRIDFFDDSASSSTSNLLTVNSAGNVSVLGALSKGSGSFKIDHPLESKKDTHHLVHSFVEAPQADNIYRGKATLSSGSVEINLDTVSGMSEGTFVLLNTDIQCFTSNESDWDAVKGSVSGNILTISCQNTDSTASVSWLVIGERQDNHMKETDWTDENGKVIVEPEKPEE